MIVLLPPSESKQGQETGAATDLHTLSFPELATARQQVADVLTHVSDQPDAPALLGVSSNLAAQIAQNLRLASAPATPVADLYTGVLYDALGLRSLDIAERSRADQRLLVVSALYGALRPTDQVAPYRLAMGVKLGVLGSLAQFWRPELARVIPHTAEDGVIVDCRSAPYVAAWRPTGEQTERWVAVKVAGVSHQAKHTRGLVARHLCVTPEAPLTPHSLTELLSATFHVSLSRPTRPQSPWALTIHPTRA